MGVPFNFKCNGVGHYICSRCGFELFNTDDKIEKHETPYPISFTKAMADNSVIKIMEPNIQPQSNQSTRNGSLVACGRCRIPIGYEYSCQENSGQTYFDIEWKSLLFVPRKICAVPWSFLI